MTITIKQRKLIGITLIIGSIPFFSFFLMMVIPVILRPEGLVDGEMMYILQIFFFDTASIVFHYPGFILIILGVYCLLKSKRKLK